MTNWTIHYTTGTVDDPSHGELIVQAETVLDAIKIAEKQGLRQEFINSIEADY